MATKMLANYREAETCENCTRLDEFDQQEDIEAYCMFQDDFVFRYMTCDEFEHCIETTKLN